MNRPSASPTQPAAPPFAPAASGGAASVSLADISLLLGHLHRLTTQAYGDADALLRDYLETGCHLFGLPTGIVSRIEADTYVVKAVHAAGGGPAAGTQFALGDTYCARVVDKEGVVAHAQADEALGHPAYMDPQLAAYISTPIWVNGAIYGTLNFSGVEPRDRAFLPQEREIIDVMAQSIGRFLERDQEAEARREAEAALQESEVRYRQLVEQAGDIMYRADMDGCFTYANAVAAQRTGYDEETLRGIHFLSLVRADAREEAIAFYARQLEEQIPNTYFEFPMTTREGATRWVGQNVQLVYDGEAVVGVQAVARDITERKQAEAALRRSEDLLKRTNRMARVGGWEYDLADGAVYWTDEVYRIHEVSAGYDPSVEEALAFYPGEARPVIEEVVRRAVEEGTPYDLELAFVTARGNRRWVRAIGEPVRGEDGATVQLIGTFQDITERKEEAIEREEAEQALSEERQFRDAVLDRMHAAVVACDADGRLTFLNRAAQAWHGLPASTAVPDAWEAHRSLYRADGTTPLPDEEIPLQRALREEVVRGAEIVIAPEAGGPVRVVECNGQPIHSEDGRLLGAVAIMHDVTARKTLEGRLSYQAQHDVLTDLPNRKQFAEHCHAAMEAYEASGTPYAVLFLDLDRFKSVNDSLGHHAGDELLQAVALRLQKCLRAADLVARLGGDEFGLLIRSARTVEGAHKIAQRLAETLRQPFMLAGCPVHTAASIGIVQGSARHATPEDLLREADTAMYRAKRENRGPVLFDPAMGEMVKTKFHLEADLYRALQQDELRVFFQPIVDLRDGALAGMEALVRWQHPERGLLAPGTFIGVAEEAGLVPEVDRWMIRAVCRQARTWRERFGDDVLLMVNVNCSHRTFLHASLITYVDQMLHESGLDPSQLAIEITERALSEDIEAAVAEMERFRKRRIRLCIDDFGVEYSSLGALQQLPVDTLKVDRSFVQRVDESEASKALVRAIGDLAHSLDLSLVAEGIETPEQLAAMQALGYEQGQGYLFARPLGAEAASEVVRGDRPWAALWPSA